MTGSMCDEITRYLRSGEHDPYFSAWPGNFWERGARAETDLKSVLVAEVRKRANGASPPALPDTDLVVLTRRKIAPMVRGLFPVREQEQVLAALERSVVFLTPATIVETLMSADWLSTAWDLANLYLGSVKAELLSPDAPRLVGLSEGTTCSVSAEYFADRVPKTRDVRLCVRGIQPNPRALKVFDGTGVPDRGAGRWLDARRRTC